MLTSNGVLFCKFRKNNISIIVLDCSLRFFQCFDASSYRSYILRLCNFRKFRKLRRGYVLRRQKLTPRQWKLKKVSQKTMYIIQLYNLSVTLFLSWLVGGGDLITCFTVWTSVSVGRTRILLTRSTNSNCSLQNDGTY